MNTGKPSGRKPSAFKPWSQPLADLVAPCLTPALRRFGFGEADLLMFWPEIVGERLASRCEPLRLQWPTRGPEADKPSPATLVVLVEGGFAVELQHQSTLVIERINTHFGWRCVGRLVLRQGPIERRAAARQKPPPPSEADRQRAETAATGVDDPDLHAALVRLGSRVLRGR